MQTISQKTFADLFAYAKSQARIEFIDYAPYVSAWRADRGRRDRARQKVMGRYGWLSDQPLPIGKSCNGRLVVTNDSIDYCVGSYAPTEIWRAVYDYLQINFSEGF